MKNCCRPYAPLVTKRKGEGEGNEKLHQIHYNVFVCFSVFAYDFFQLSDSVYAISELLVGSNSSASPVRSSYPLPFGLT